MSVGEEQTEVSIGGSYNNAKQVKTSEYQIFVNVSNVLVCKTRTTLLK